LAGGPEKEVHFEREGFRLPEKDREDLYCPARGKNPPGEPAFGCLESIGCLCSMALEEIQREPEGKQ